MGKDNFILYNNMYKAIKCMSDECLGKLTRALFEYNMNGSETDDPDILVAFMFIKNQIDLDTEKYNQICERNRLNGQNGGRPKKPTGLSGFDEKPKKPDKDKDKDNDKDILKKENIKEKKSYGEFENVNLTDDELNKLKDKYPNDYLERIDRLSSYIASKGARYKSHYATILNWARKDDLIKPRPKTQREKDDEFWAKLDKEIEDEKRRSKEDT